MNRLNSERDRGIMSLYSATSGYHNPHKWYQSRINRVTRSGQRDFRFTREKKNCWTFFAAAAQVYGGRIHESVESIEMTSSYEIRVSLEFSRGARICYYVRRTSGYSPDKMVAGC
ncbi:hypothetical protein YC2023_100080 [Brassica napus]